MPLCFTVHYNPSACLEPCLRAAVFCFYCLISRGCSLHYFIACSVSKLLWVYCPGHAEWREMTEQIDGRVKQPSQVACFLGRSAVLRSLRHYLRVQSQRHYTTDRLKERGMERGRTRWSSLKGWERAFVNQTILGTVSKTTLRKLLREGVECIYGLFQAHLELSWTVAGDSPCASNNGGCEQLCFALPNPNNTTPDTAKCGCASGALSSDGKTCQGDDLLVMSLCSVLTLCIWRYNGTVETGHITWKSFKIKVVVGL